MSSPSTTAAAARADFLRHYRETGDPLCLELAAEAERNIQHDIDHPPMRRAHPKVSNTGIKGISLRHDGRYSIRLGTGRYVLITGTLEDAIKRQKEG